MDLWRHFKAWLNGYGYIQAVASIGVALGGGAVIARILQVYANVTDEWHKALLLLIAGLFLATFAWKQNRDKKGSFRGVRVEDADRAVSVAFSPPSELTGPYLRGHHIRIIDLLQHGEFTIKDRTLEDCHIYGPAIVVLFATSMFECTMEGKKPAILYEVAPDREAIGIIAISGCTIRKCTFHYIGFMGPPTFVKQMRDSVPEVL